MKKLNLLLFMVLAVVAGAYAQEETRSFNVKDFEKLSMGSAFKINLKQGKNFRVVATGQRRDLDDLEAKVSGGKLSIRYKENGRNRKGVHFEIEMPELSGIDLSGAASMKAGKFNTRGNFDLDVSGAAKLELELDAETVDFDLSGASSTELSGRANSLRGDISGASSLRAGKFPVKEVEIDASGASSASVQASARLSGDASGASSIRYSGGAKEIRVNSSGGSSIRRSE
ncbi:hypothetical protein GCM10023091_15140 [Ravibacter arvi]|uniref:Putative auto-transporter adhesin head GIN domain-containing protein n=1 Tax=Ravibacter arvi TaxID=2051041 RepID=A0ABP8LWY5_9BACT